MKLRQNYPYNEALDDFECFIEKHVTDQVVKDELKGVIDDARQRKTVPMRGLHSKYVKYRKKSQNYTTFTPEEREMMDDLIQFWC